MVSKVCLCLLDISPFTFSKSMFSGFLTLQIRMMSWNNVPLVSNSPLPLPAVENVWHGNPPVKKLKSGNSLVLIFVISP